MSTEIKAPVFPESVAEGTVATWHKQPGEACSRDDLIVDIETDKVVLEVVAPADGVIEEILKGEGDTVESGEVIGKFKAGAVGDSGSSDSKASSAASEKDEAKTEQSQDSGDAILSPAARKLADENNVDPATVKGTGKDGRVTKEDVQNHVDTSKASGGSAKAAAPSAVPEVNVAAGERPEKRVPMTRLRASIAKRLVNAQQTAAMLTTFNEVDMGPIMELRKAYQDSFVKRHDIKLGFMSFFAKAATEALKRFPAVNASIDGNDMVYHGYQDIGVAVSTERGLVVPVVRDVDALGLADIEKKIVEYGTKAKDGKLAIEDMTGGTFTITNGGIFGSLLSTPILNPPQTAILGMHKIQERPMAVNGKVKIRPMMYLALSYDHRMVDGKEAVQFLVAIKDMLEDPARILLDV
ncbi:MULTISPECIES: 2-oxoglutarate dehydrogenase complex dihydrolipoyllysine-residue succinyltransferase [Marinobacter]|uniref:Dihydrolipoyllysine-residue succinyltransferase component of 2-oxoglutarate dehydrogenase complex n=1 Tax=Marinobacter xiaoshiensis TaxID=3073652 RepID=A0ABU2HG04_9GAMM|nr:MULTISPECIES: 2-oxoglutarate dehydrogenase complex dihydrolipoyllysine-residue succinyltransferase [unclassified Marinobacter]MBK1874834.1 2-oxoglutarate dehydrogenase complex dihydrolipoyllysine-residue succinyltransferase [Marinobacter sp. 1-3A]MBK1887714.1 2-oxoglutarate dehydrogenase complex dihydrolipoyllysine-residue succinyltransferase [Marinobacter sp. DY40_1A1]MDS1310009.1 2-oxoglutarate dehydrogenase complex dihydrolipoyllysine-residue succinyltransferase [Marinobacter sp. F60267]